MRDTRDSVLENFRLKVFRAVAGQRNFRRAAEHLYISQPAVTQQVKALEESVGMPLFDRTGREINLTRAGAILLRYAEQSNLVLLKAIQEIAETQGEIRGPLKIAVSTTIAQYVLPEILSEFVRLHPSVQLKIQSANTEAVVEAVIEEAAGLGLVEGPAHSRKVETEPWMEDELILAVPPSHEWAGTAGVSVRQIATAQLLMRERGSGTREVIERALAKTGIPPRRLHCTMELNSTEAILACIEAGLGIGFVSLSAVRRQMQLNTLVVVPVHNLEIRREFTLVRRRGPAQGNAAALLSFLRDYREQRMRKPAKFKR
jgi:LysR family transcriptional regulator, transcriptional activator of the cysJI operon